MQELSLKEKVDLLTGADSFTLPALARIGLRALRTSAAAGERRDEQAQGTLHRALRRKATAQREARAHRAQLQCTRAAARPPGGVRGGGTSHGAVLRPVSGL